MAQQQDRSGFDGSPIAALYQREALAVFAYIKRRVPSREDAEDLLLEVFLAALEYETLADLPAERQRAWLLRVAHNKVIDHRRYASYRTAVPLEDVSEKIYSASEIEPDQALLAQEEYEQLQANVKRLPALQQEILHLRFTAGMPYTEIAQRLNKREGAVRTLFSRSLSFLRHIYRQP